ncbi:hypothetical protein QAD02_014199 [Eretmocerus hayati]|uniref:Uncharacterized protein n=1 Tax=Eretmocerus hayati TaxID=131215 RepID=A0ACC2P4T8_9HYME|nr:hypothetical protein QAD02_014199 [Eretmocerus hayati]
MVRFDYQTDEYSQINLKGLDSSSLGCLDPEMSCKILTTVSKRPGRFRADRWRWTHLLFHGNRIVPSTDGAFLHNSSDGTACLKNPEPLEQITVNKTISAMQSTCMSFSNEQNCYMMILW